MRVNLSQADLPVEPIPPLSKIPITFMSNTRGSGNAGAWVRGRGGRYRGGSSDASPGVKRGGGPSNAKPPRQVKMELIASVSRSSGLEKDGDALKIFRTQEEYKSFIQDKVDTLRQPQTRAVAAAETPKEALNRKDKQGNILILFRKLREGIVASKRTDQFAVEAFETSAYLAIIFESPRDTTTPLAHLVPDLYSKTPSPLMHLTTLLSLVHHIVAAYPSQGTYRHHLQGIPPAFLPESSDSRLWIESLAASLRAMNYTKFERLSHARSFAQLCIVDSQSPNPHAKLAAEALYVLVDALRDKAREMMWRVIRSAYRDVNCDPASGTTREWLARSLALPTSANENAVLDDWFEKKAAEGQVKKKEGATEGRWIIYKV